MRKWSIAFLVVLLACIPIWIKHSSGPDLLRDSDTIGILNGGPDRDGVVQDGVRHRANPLSWFASDWPLGNHFYRPVATLTFVVDDKLYGDNPAGYGLTNALLAIGCVLMLFWFFRELTANPVLTAGACSIFAFWTAGVFYDSASAVLRWLGLAGIAFAIIFLLVRSVLLLLDRGTGQSPELMIHRFVNTIVLCLTTVYASYEVSPQLVTQIDQLPYRMIGWLPGRTASVMTLFALLSMSAYARYERTTAKRAAPPNSPLNPPATKGSETRVKPSRLAWVWPVVACVAAALALCSYEQSVMLPAALLGVAVAFRMQRYKVRWGWQIAFWLLLVGYIVVRHAVLPSSVSGYQQQQLRSGPTVLLSILDYVLPCAHSAWQTSVSMSWESFFVLPNFWETLLLAASNVTAYIAARKRWVFALTGWALSIITYLPMAWVKPFEHYHFWPMAMRSLFAVTMVWVAWDRFAIAASRPALQAPARLHPAPGSLPHP